MARKSFALPNLYLPLSASRSLTRSWFRQVIDRLNPADEVRQASGTRSNDYLFNLFAVNNGGRLFPESPEHRSHFMINVMNFGNTAVFHGGINSGIASGEYPEYAHGTRFAHLRGRSGFNRYG